MLFTCLLKPEPAPHVAVTGEVDLATADEVHRTALEAIRVHGPALRVDLSEVSFMGVAGLEVLDDTRRYAESIGGQLELHNPSPPVTKVLLLTGLDQVFAVHAS